MPTSQQRAAFAAALPAAEAAWVEAELHGSATLPPPVVTAVAVVLGIDPDALWDHVEGIHGWEPHDEGYEDAVWAAAGCGEHEETAAAGLLPPHQPHCPARNDWHRRCECEPPERYGDD